METFLLTLEIIGLIAAIFAGYVAFLYVVKFALDFLKEGLRDDTAERH